MSLLLLGLDHQTAAVEVRERLAFTPGQTAAGVAALRSLPGFAEAVILSTCNRTEVYALTPDSPGAGSAADASGRDWPALERFLHRAAGGVIDFRPHLVRREGADAARHLLRVACGLESMILGESQILGQVKAAMQTAESAGGLGRVLSALFRQALTTGKRARTETEIGRGAVSVSHAAVELAREIFGGLAGRTALILGAGETGELAVRLLAEQGVSTLIVANRTFERACALAEDLGGDAVTFDRLGEALARADIVIGSTAAPHPILTREMAVQAAHRRRGRPLLLIDIAVPRDVDPRAGDVAEVFLYDIDDLQSLVDRNLGERLAEAGRVEGIIEEELARFLAWWRSLEVVPVLTGLQAKFEAVRQAEWEKIGGRLDHLSPRDRELVETLTRGIVKRLLSSPMARLKAAAGRPESALYADALRELFDLGSVGKDGGLGRTAGTPASDPPEACAVLADQELDV